MTTVERDAPARLPENVQMNKELFGVFGDPDAFDALRDEAAFDAVARGEAVTVGVRDGHLGYPGRTDLHEGAEGVCAVWGEAYLDGHGTDVARRLLAAVAERGRDAFGDLNGSYVAVVEYDGRPVVATDQLRSWECFYADVAGTRAFGTDLGALAPLLDDLPVDRRALLEFLHLGTVLGERTLFEPVRRVPFDTLLTPDGVETLSRFVYEPAEFDYATELSDRLRRAIGRRTGYPDRKGLLLSAGQDSRSILAAVPGLESCYTVGWPDSQEVAVARELASQYGTDHVAVTPDERYLLPVDGKVRYSQGLRESLHVHHAGYDDDIQLESVYHGLLYDTLFKGYFLERDGVDVLGKKIPLGGVDPDVDPVASLLDTLGYMPAASARLVDRAGGLLAELAPGIDLDADPEALLRESFEAELDACYDRADSVHNAMDQLVIRNQPVLPFHAHLADNYAEAFVAADAELLEWHLRTPPEHRHSGTVYAAIADLDGEVFRHRPPGRLRRSPLLNHVERFVRRKLPLVSPAEPAWPDRGELYERYDLDRRLFPDHPEVRELPARLQLRLNDLRWWLSAVE